MNDASHVDMCTILTDQELTNLGVDLSSRKQEEVLRQVGCGWVGHPISLDLARDTDTVAVYIARRNDPAFTSFHENTVNGRAGVQIGVRPGRDQCAQFFDGGSVSLVVSVALAFSAGPPKVDPCAEALRIAQMIEPRLPKAGT